MNGTFTMFNVVPLCNYVPASLVVDDASHDQGCGYCTSGIVLKILIVPRYCPVLSIIIYYD